MTTSEIKNISEIKTILENHLRNKPKPTIELDRKFLGIHIKGGIFLELGPYSIHAGLDGCDYVVYHNGVMIYPIVVDRYEDEICEDFPDCDSDEDIALDFTACSLDDCGYCGKCMY